MGVLLGISSRRCFEVHRFSPGFVGSVVRYGAGQTAWGLAAVFGVGLVSGVFGVGGGWALVQVFNLVMVDKQHRMV